MIPIHESGVVVCDDGEMVRKNRYQTILFVNLALLYGLMKRMVHKNRSRMISLPVYGMVFLHYGFCFIKYIHTFVKLLSE